MRFILDLMKRTIGIILFSLLVSGTTIWSQRVGLDTSNTSIQIDTLDVETKIKKERNPKRAALYSLLFPGAGQIYNGKIWKAPIVYAGLGTTIYLIDYNRDFYRCLRDAYILRLNNEEDKYTGIISSADGIKNARDSFRKDMELAYFATAAVYLLQVIEAYIDAHLQTFDVDEDLSIHLGPVAPQPGDIAIAKIGLTVSL